MTSPVPDPSPPQPGPLGRSIRQLVIVLVAVGGAVPAALALVPIPDRYAGSVATVVGIAAALVLVLTVALNAAEGKLGGPLIAAPHPLPVATTVRPLADQLAQGRRRRHVLIADTPAQARGYLADHPVMPQVLSAWTLVTNDDQANRLRGLDLTDDDVVVNLATSGFHGDLDHVRDLLAFARR